MICTKCNSEVPNGAKFCPVCGNACGSASDVKPAVPPAQEQKSFCGKCGLELRRGAKFCAVCGTPAAVGDIKPAVNDGAVFGRGDMSAVSLDKPDASDSLVAAMSSASTGTAVSSGTVVSPGVPTPSNSVPSPSGSGYSPGFGGYGNTDINVGFIPESPVAPPSYAPAADTANTAGFDNPFGDMGAAAVVAAPIKKKKTGAKVAIIIAAVLAVLIAAAAVFFFTNKATALSLIMGKPKYATMVEGNSIKAATEKLDLPSFANGIKSASGVIAQLSSVNGGYIGSGSFDGADMSVFPGVSVAPMMSVYSTDGFNMEEFISGYNKLLADTYGVNSLTSTFSAEVKLSDSVGNMLRDELGDEFDELIKLINSTSFTTSVNTAQDKLGVSAGLSSGSSVIDAKALFTKDGDIYIVFPFISDTGIMIKIPTSESSGHTTVAVLELDEKEIERLIGELVELYLAEYAECAIEMENGELSAAGLTATGKLITAEFKGEKLSELFNKLAEHVADDEYFSSKIVDFANECGANITKQDYKKAIMDAVDFDADNSDKLTISTVIDNSGNVLAKSYKAADGDETAKLTYVNSKDQFTLEASRDGELLLSVVCDITSESEGAVTFKCSDGYDGTVTVKMTYSDIAKAEFCGQSTVTGKFTVGMELPADFTEDIPEELGKLSNVKMTFSVSVNGQNTMESTVGVEMGNLGSMTVKSAVTAENSDAGLALPSDVIEIGDINETPDEATVKELEEYVKNAVEKFKGLKDGAFGKLLDDMGLFDELDGMVVPAEPLVDVTALGDDVNRLIQTALSLGSQYGVSDEALNARAGTLVNDLTLLYGDLNAAAADGKVSQSDFDTFNRRYSTLKGQVEALEADYKLKAEQQLPTNPTDPNAPGGAESLDYDAMTDAELIGVLDEYEMRYLALFTEEILTKIFTDPALEAMYNECESAYSKVVDDCTQFLDKYAEGNYSVAILRNLRKSTKAFTVAVEKLEKAVQVTVQS